MKKIALTALSITTIIASTFSYANFQIQTLGGSCADLAGKWKGNGRASNWMVDCNYHGDATITMTDDNHFVFFANVDKDKGSFVCPSHTEQTLTGACENGNVVIATDYGTLTGTATKTQGHASGTLKLIPGVSADVNIDFNR